MYKSGYILLADDNPTDAELTTRALQIGGVSAPVVWVQDGVAALDYIFRQGQYAGRPVGHPLVMLLDMHMPKVDGIDVLERIKSDPQTRSIPVVVMSSSDQPSDLASCYVRHANSFLVKPVEFKAFTDQVAALGQYWTRVNRALT